jgi:hypothetical protein
MKKIVKLTESELTKLIQQIIIEADEKEEKYEKGKSGVRAARSRADFEATPKEGDIMKDLFGKYSDDIPPIVVRYLRKMGKKALTKRLINLNMIDPETVIDEFDLGEK